jgi:iron complex transport system substrate-binding protein
MRKLMIIASIGLFVPGADARDIFDMAGRSVEIPDRPQRISCLEAMCYHHMLMFNAQDKVVSRVQSFPPWAARTNPSLSAIPTFASQPNLEDILARHPDLAFASANYGLPLSALSAFGVPAIVSQPVRPAKSAEQFIADAKTMVRLAGEALGGEAPVMAETWCAYFDERLRFVQGRVAAIPQEERLKLYYARGPNVTNTHGKGGFFNWVAHLAGARMPIDEDGPVLSNAQISFETLVLWNPDAIVVGRQYSPDIVTGDSRLAELKAVRSRRIWSSPEGVWYWDGGAEQVLLLQFLAKRLYPDLFLDLDLAGEVKSYYARFYRTSLSDDDVANLLDGRSPDGSRSNPMRN